MDYKLPIPNKTLNSWIFFQETGFNLHMRDGELFVCGELTLAEAKALLAAHNPEA